ncbi:MAG: hypothetical protein K0Q55_3732 [Verrucomicrobia bacterium]|nr:hypothetical protein [Verrucomicrobiota bacterium]
MRSSTENRLLLTLAVTALLAGNVFSRDKVRGEGELPKDDVAVTAKAVRETLKRV